MKKLPLKFTYFLASFVLSHGLSLFTFQMRTFSQEELHYYMIESSGHVQNLNSLCKPNKPRENMYLYQYQSNNTNQDSVRIEMVKKGKQLMLEERYQEAITIFTQAV
jgi:hypothetical protein